MRKYKQGYQHLLAAYELVVAPHLPYDSASPGSAKSIIPDPPFRYPYQCEVRALVFGNQELASQPRRGRSTAHERICEAGAQRSGYQYLLPACIPNAAPSSPLNPCEGCLRCWLILVSWFRKSRQCTVLALFSRIQEFSRTSAAGGFE